MKEGYPEENIYNLIPREEIKITKPPRYISTFRDAAKAEKHKNRAACKTMGPAEVKVPSPKEYLQKHTNEAKLSQKSDFPNSTDREPRCLDEGKRRPPVPLHTEHPAMGVHSNKSFIKTNVAEAVMAVPKKPQPIVVDTKKGDKQVLETSGLVPKYVKKKHPVPAQLSLNAQGLLRRRQGPDCSYRRTGTIGRSRDAGHDYGSTPEYLLKRNEEVRQAQEEYDAYVKRHLKMGAMKVLSEAERQTVLQGLKKNWDELNHDYQHLSVVIDTPPKKAYKERLEAEMKKLEHDIDVMERHKVIYIANN